MVRTQISLTELEKRVLDELSARSGKSLSSLIRTAVDAMYLGDRGIEADLAAVDAAFGVRGLDSESGEEFVERVRSGRRLQDLR